MSPGDDRGPDHREGERPPEDEVTGMETTIGPDDGQAEDPAGGRQPPSREEGPPDHGRGTRPANEPDSGPVEPAAPPESPANDRVDDGRQGTAEPHHPDSTAGAAGGGAGTHRGTATRGGAGAAGGDLAALVRRGSTVSQVVYAAGVFGLVGAAMGLADLVAIGQLRVVSGFSTLFVIPMAVFVAPVVSVVVGTGIPDRMDDEETAVYFASFLANAVGFLVLVLVTATLGSLAGRGYALFDVLGDLVLVLAVLPIPIGLAGVGATVLARRDASTGGDGSGRPGGAPQTPTAQAEAGRGQATSASDGVPPGDHADGGRGGQPQGGQGRQPRGGQGGQPQGGQGGHPHGGQPHEGRDDQPSR